MLWMIAVIKVVGLVCLLLDKPYDFTKPRIDYYTYCHWSRPKVWMCMSYHNNGKLILIDAPSD